MKREVCQLLILTVLEQMFIHLKTDPEIVKFVVESEGRMVCYFPLHLADENGRDVGKLPVMVDVVVAPCGGTTIEPSRKGFNNGKQNKMDRQKKRPIH